MREEDILTVTHPGSSTGRTRVAGAELQSVSGPCLVGVGYFGELLQVLDGASRQQGARMVPGP